MFLTLTQNSKAPERGCLGDVKSGPRAPSDESRLSTQISQSVSARSDPQGGLSTPRSRISPISGLVLTDTHGPVTARRRSQLLKRTSSSTSKGTHAHLELDPWTGLIAAEPTQAPPASLTKAPLTGLQHRPDGPERRHERSVQDYTPGSRCFW